MTPSRHIARLFAILVAFMLLGIFFDYSCTAHAGQVRHTRRMTRITVLRPVRATGRARAGYPFLQTTANVTRIGANLSGLINPIGWFF